jgi:hypothetical protein
MLAPRKHLTARVPKVAPREVVFIELVFIELVFIELVELVFGRFVVLLLVVISRAARLRAGSNPLDDSQLRPLRALGTILSIDLHSRRPDVLAQAAILGIGAVAVKLETRSAQTAAGPSRVRAPQDHYLVAAGATHQGGDVALLVLLELNLAGALVRPSALLHATIGPPLEPPLEGAWSFDAPMIAISPPWGSPVVFMSGH